MQCAFLKFFLVAGDLFTILALKFLIRYVYPGTNQHFEFLNQSSEKNWFNASKNWLLLLS